MQELVQGFDQETAAVVMARLTSLKMEAEVLPEFFCFTFHFFGFSFTANDVLAITFLFLKYPIGHCNVVDPVCCQSVTVSCLPK